MIKLFSPESFRDYITANPATQPTYETNGTIVLEPSACELEITGINESWQLKLTHPYDEEGRYSYITKGSVLKLPCKVAREQQHEEQLFRIFEVRDNFGQLEALAYPIAMESTYETPVYYHMWKKVTAKQMADSLSLIYPKYRVTTDYMMANDFQPPIDQVKARLKELEKGGNVNLLNRPEIPASELVNAGWTEAGDDDIATVYSSTFSNEARTKYYNFTPIIDDPKTGQYIRCIGPNELTSYAEAVIEGARKDTQNCQIGGPFNTLSAATDAAEEIHELHEDLHNYNEYKETHPNHLKSILAQQTNIQGIIQGDSDYTMVNQFNLEVVYDNYTYIVNRVIGKKNSYKDNKIFYAANLTGIDITENTSDLITRIYPMSGEGTRYTDSEGNFSYVDAENINKYPIVYARVVKYDNIRKYEQHTAEEKVPQNSLQKLTQQCKAVVKARVRDLSRKYLIWAHKGEWDHSEFNRYKFVDDGNQEYLENFEWKYDGKGYYYGDGNGHYLKNAWVEDASNKHYWVNGQGYWDPDYDDTTGTWQWYGSDADGWRYGVKNPSTGEFGAYCQHQWMKINKKWYWFNQNGYWIEDTSGGADPDKERYFTNPHDTSVPMDEYKTRWALPYGYLFYSYTDAIEYLKDMALIDIGAKCQTLEERQDRVANVNDPDPDEDLAAKQEIWDLFADAIQQGFKWCETTEIAEWDWREWSTTTEDPEKNYLKDYEWHKEYVDAEGKIVPKSQSVGTKWWYGYLEKSNNPNVDDVYHCIKKGWVEESHYKHYWMDEDGWWDSTQDDTSEWAWQTTASGTDWYGSKTNSANYATGWIYDSQAGKWYFLDSNGAWTQDRPLWAFGTKNLSDMVTFAWHKVGNTWWWFDKDGFLDPLLAYCENFQWHTEDEDDDDSDDSSSSSSSKRQYYGDSDGHILKDCWVEDSTGVHKYVDADGWWQEDDDDDSSSDDSTDDNSEDGEDDNNTEDNSSDDTQNGSNDTNDGDSDDDTSSKDDRTGVTYDNENWSWHGEKDTDGHTKYWYGRYYQNSKGVEDTSRKQYYAKNQWMYVSENSAWYWFDENGWCKAAWTSKATWEWQKDNTGWWYGDGSGGQSTYYRGQWGKINNKWYYFDHNGYADQYTDDFDASKNESTGSATLETNRDGINRVYDDSSPGSQTTIAGYDEKREGVQAWIQKEFIEKVRATVNAQHKRLIDGLNSRLKAQAKADLKVYSQATLTIEADLALLDKMDGYEKYQFLHDVYLGDWVRIYAPEYITGEDGQLDERIVGLTYDCIAQRNSKVVLGAPKNFIYTRIAKLNSTEGTIVEGDDTDILETGYEGDGTKYLDASRRDQYIEG